MILDLSSYSYMNFSIPARSPASTDELVTVQPSTLWKIKFLISLK